MRPIEETLGVDDLLQWIPLSKIHAGLLARGLDEGFLSPEDIIRVVQLKDEAGLPLSPPEERIARMYVDPDLIQVILEIRAAEELTDSTHEESETTWFYVGAAKLAAIWPSDEEGEIIISMLVDHFLMHSELPHLLYYSPRPFWRRRTSVSEMGDRFKDYVAKLRADGSIR